MPRRQRLQPRVAPVERHRPRPGRRRPAPEVRPRIPPCPPSAECLSEACHASDGPRKSAGGQRKSRFPAECRTRLRPDPLFAILRARIEPQLSGDVSVVLLLVIICGALSIVYGVWAARSVMAADAGNARMQEIAAAIQEGADAYLRRQYTTIAIVGVVIFVIVAWLLGITAAIGFLIGAVLSGAAGFIGMLVSVRANVRTAQAASSRLAEGLALAFKSGAVTGMLVAGLALLGVAVYFCILTRLARLRPHRPRRHRLAGRPRLRRLADLDLRPSRRRHLHQGRRRRRRPGRQGRGRHPRGRSAQPRHHRRQRRRQCRRLRRHGGRPLRDLCRDRGRHHGARLDLLRRPGRRLRRHAPAARDRRRLRPHLDRRHLLRQARRPNNTIMGALYKGFIATGVLSLVAALPADRAGLPGDVGAD